MHNDCSSFIGMKTIWELCAGFIQKVLWFKT